METYELIGNLLVWLTGFFFLFRIPTCRLRNERRGRYPHLSIIIPARNEEENLPALLGSLQAQEYVPDEVIVVDDHSTDETAAVARLHGARVVAAKPLPEGWVGKTWACHQGAEAVEGTILLFLDADTVLEPHGLARMLATFDAGPGALSVQPYHTVKRPSEQLSAFFNIMQMGATRAFTILGERWEATGLFGPSLMVRRVDYRAAGGHESVKGKILEDYFLARNFRARSIPIRCLGGRGALSFRMYPGGLVDIIRGWSKAFAAGAGRTSLPILVVLVAWVAGCADTTRNLIGTAWTGVAMAGGAWLALYLGYALQIHWMLRRIGSFRPYTALLFPIPLAFFVVVFLWSLFVLIRRRPVTWKARTVRTD